VTQVDGANGGVIGDSGDTLGYSAALGDIDNDGIPDIIVNEMVGNGLQPFTIDVGNLIILSGATVAPAVVPSLGPLAAAASIVLLAGAAVLEMLRGRRG
jgi:hypothetical protein